MDMERLMGRGKESQKYTTAVVATLKPYLFKNDDRHRHRREPHRLKTLDLLGVYLFIGH